MERLVCLVYLYMEVILLRDVAKVGRKNTVVTVSEGYALNFLIPKGMAKAATASALHELEVNTSKLSAAHAETEKKTAVAVQSLEGKTVTIRTRLNEQGNLFAALKAEDITAAIYDQFGISLPQEALNLSTPLREGGTHTLSLSGGGATGSLTLAIVQK